MTGCNSSRDVRRSIPAGHGPALVGPEPDALAQALLLPNPASSSVRLVLPGAQQTTTIRLLDPLGHELRRWHLAPGTSLLEIDVSSLARGPHAIVVTQAHSSRFLPLLLR